MPFFSLEMPNGSLRDNTPSILPWSHVLLWSGGHSAGEGICLEAAGMSLPRGSLTNYWPKAVDEKIEVSFMCIGRFDAKGGCTSYTPRYSYHSMLGGWGLTLPCGGLSCPSFPPPLVVGRGSLEHLALSHQMFRSFSLRNTLKQNFHKAHGSFAQHFANNQKSLPQNMI